MTERMEFLESIAITAADYREDEIGTTTPDHVDRWLRQFEVSIQLPLLREIDQVLKKTYFSRKTVLDFLEKLVSTKKLAGSNSCDFWRKAHFLRIQQNGHSQEELLDTFDAVLNAKCGIITPKCGANGGDFIYIDDAIFSGNRVGTDLATWIEKEAPSQAVVHVIVVATHSFAEYKMPKRIQEEATARKKKITLQVWRIATFENRLSNRNTSEVLWPTELPENKEIKAYLAEEQKYPFVPRKPGGKTDHNIFSSEQGRQLLERELLLAGMKIRSFCKNPSRALRPLGFSPFGLGFGSMIVTFRNCPNNCPLALWWGDPEAGPAHPFSRWYPLFPRKTYNKEVSFDDFLF